MTFMLRLNYLKQITKGKNKMSKNKKEFKKLKKLGYIAVAVSELSAVVTLSILTGDIAQIAGKIIALPLAIDFLVRAKVILEPFLKSE